MTSCDIMILLVTILLVLFITSFALTLSSSIILPRR